MCPARTRSLHRNVDGDWVLRSNDTCGLDPTMDLDHTIRPHGQSPLPVEARAFVTKSFRTACGYLPAETLHHKLDKLMQSYLA
jgi:hypothetical protein